MVSRGPFMGSPSLKSSRLSSLQLHLPYTRGVHRIGCSWLRSDGFSPKFQQIQEGRCSPDALGQKNAGFAGYFLLFGFFEQC